MIPQSLRTLSISLGLAVLAASSAQSTTLSYAFTGTMSDGGVLTGGYDYNVFTRETTGLAVNLTGGTTPNADAEVVAGMGESIVYAEDATTPVANSTAVLSVVAPFGGDLSRLNPLQPSLSARIYTCPNFVDCFPPNPVSFLSTFSVSLLTPVVSASYDLTGSFTDGGSFSASVLYSLDDLPLQVTELLVEDSTLSDGQFDNVFASFLSTNFSTTPTSPSDLTGVVGLTFSSFDFADFRQASPVFSGTLVRCNDAACDPFAADTVALSGTMQLTSVTLAAVPLPAGGALLGVGLSGLLLVRRKRT